MAEVKAASSTASSAEPARPKRHRGPPPDVLGGRFALALVLLIGMSFVPYCEPLGKWLDKKGPPPADPRTWTVGSTHTVKVTLVTADYDALDCASPQTIEGQHCAYSTTSSRFARAPGAPLDDNKQNIIQPYRSWPDNHLLTLSNLWTHPEISMRLHREPPGNLPKEKLARFVAECEVKFIGHLEKPSLRWFQTGSWGQEQGNVVVGNAQRCKLISDDL